MSKVKKILASILMLTLVITLLSPVARAETVTVTDEQLKKVMDCYNNILATNPYDDIEGGFTAETFLLKDLDQDGIPELIINGEAPQIFSYDLKKDQVMFIYSSWVYNTMYYSNDKKTILYSYEWHGKKNWTIYEFKNTQENDCLNVLKDVADYSYTDGKYDKYDTFKMKKGYYKGNYEFGDAKKTTKKTVFAAFDKLVPNKVELKTTIKNTKENRDKYVGNLEQFKEFGTSAK
jgi:hypothetical protein